MLFDTVQFIAPTSTIVNPKIEGEVKQVSDVPPSAPESLVNKKYFEDTITPIQGQISSLNTQVTTLNSTATSLQGQINANKIYDIGVFIGGKPTASAIQFRLVAPRAFSLPANLTGSIAKAGTAAAAATTMNLVKNGTTIGSVSFAAGATSGTFSFAQAVSFAVGDTLDLMGPTTQDNNLADISLILVAVLV